MITTVNNITINLTDSSYKWFSNKKVFARGYGFVEENLFTDKALVDYFNEANDISEAQQRCLQLDGFFSVIICFKQQVFAAVDHLRSLPLFYWKESSGEDKYTITDHISTTGISNKEVNPEAIKHLKKTLFVMGKYTVFNEVYQIEAGNYAVFSKYAAGIDNYWKYSYCEAQTEDMAIAVDILDVAFRKSIKNLIMYLNGRQAVIPLSGGHDSRLIAYYLKKEFGYDNILAYSYGHHYDTSEDAYSEKIANALGIDYIFIPYKPKECIPFFEKEYKKYFELSSNGTSIPHVQELYAFKHLIESKAVTRDSIVVPGYTGDFLAGGHLKKFAEGVDSVTKKDLLTFVAKRHCTEDMNLLVKIFFKLKLVKPQANDYIIEKLNSYGSLEVLPVDKFNELQEELDLCERQGKFIENAVRVYEYYGLKWVTPFFDKIQFKAYAQISNKLRYGREVFFSLEEKIYPQNIRSIGFYTGRGREFFIADFFNPLKKHYLNAYIRLIEYIKNAILHSGNVNQYFTKLYLNMVKKIKAG